MLNNLPEIQTTLLTYTRSHTRKAVELELTRAPFCPLSPVQPYPSLRPLALSSLLVRTQQVSSLSVLPPWLQSKAHVLVLFSKLSMVWTIDISRLASSLCYPAAYNSATFPDLHLKSFPKSLSPWNTLPAQSCSSLNKVHAKWYILQEALPDSTTHWD